MSSVGERHPVLFHLLATPSLTYFSRRTKVELSRLKLIFQLVVFLCCSGRQHRRRHSSSISAISEPSFFFFPFLVQALPLPHAKDSNPRPSCRAYSSSKRTGYEYSMLFLFTFWVAAIQWGFMSLLFFLHIYLLFFLWLGKSFSMYSLKEDLMLHWLTSARYLFSTELCVFFFWV